MYDGRDAIPCVSNKCVRPEDRFQVDTITFSKIVCTDHYFLYGYPLAQLKTVPFDTPNSLAICE